jgi:integrase
MRAGEITSITWGQVDFRQQVITVGKAKSVADTGRQIPMSRDLVAVLAVHSAWFTKRFGQAEAWHYLFPFGKPTPKDPSKPITDVTGA